jgi:ParB-like chromosome segregation protein Spo0J
MEIRIIPIDEMNPAKYNPRRELQPGSPAYEKLRKSLAEFGYVEPIVWNRRTGNIVGGHQRFSILKAEGNTEIECSVVDMDLLKEKELNLALNKVSGYWDMDSLADLLQEIQSDGNIDVTGFDKNEVAKLVAGNDLVEKIKSETEHEHSQEQANSIADSFEKRVKDIAKQYPEQMNQAIGVVVPTTGNEVLIITDPALNDFIVELRRYADAGIYSPLEKILEQVVPMKWS